MVHINTKSGNWYTYDPRSNRVLLGKQTQLTPFSINNLGNSYIDKIDGISQFTIEITRNCNFRCAYCVYSGSYSGRRTHEESTMDYTRINQVIEFINNKKDKGKPVSISFYGGEALLAKNEIDYFIERASDVIESEVEYRINTNGYLIIPALIDKLCSYSNLSIAVSIDGDKSMHDLYRRTKTGEDTYNTILENLTYFKSAYPEMFNNKVEFISTIPDLKSYILLSDFWKNDVFLKDKLPINVTVISGNKFSYKEKVLLLYEALKRYKDGDENDVSVNYLLQFVAAIKRRPISEINQEHHVLNHCLQSPSRCFIDVNGDLAPCESIADTFRIGNVSSGFDYEEINSYVQKYTQIRNNRCKNCWAFRICRVCMVCTAFSSSEMDELCKHEQEWRYLSLLFMCEISELSLKTHY